MTRTLVRSSARALLVVSLVLFGAASAQAAPITGGAGPGGFMAANGASNLQLWMRADQGVTHSGGAVSAWADQSGYGHDGTQATAGARPTFNASLASMNNMPTINFGAAGAHHRLELLSSSAADITRNAPAVTMLSVVRHTSTSGSQTHFYSSTGGAVGTTRSILRGNSNQVHAGGRRVHSDGFGAVEGGTQGTAPYIAAGILDYQANQALVYKNAVELNVNNNPWPSSSGNTENTASLAVSLGGIVDSTTHSMRGDIAEVIVFNRRLNSAERLIAEHHLGAKYNVGGTQVGSDFTLGANDRYAGKLAANGNYDFDVFGIGRVDASNQVFSSGAAGFGIDVTGQTLANDNWAFAGRNSLDNLNSLVSTDLGGTGMDFRWERDWYVDVTGSFGATLTFDFSDADLESMMIGAVALLRRDGLSGDYSVVSTLTQVVSGDTVMFTLAPGALIDGYYTLGVNPVIPEPSTALLLGMAGTVLAGTRRRRARR